MKCRRLFFSGLLLAAIISAGNMSGAQPDSSSDRSQSIYTGTTNSAPETEAPAPAPKKKKKSVVPAATAAASTNAPATAVTNSVASPAAATAPSTNAPSAAVEPPAPSVHVTSLAPADLKEFADQTPAIQALIIKGLALTQLNLNYQYGSDDPAKGGMDCSGTVHYLLEQVGLKDVPRDASEIYAWAWKEGHVQPVTSSNPKTFELDRLKPGDLLFWTGTYDSQHDPPITHVMIYLGTNRQDGRRVMVGASEGRTYKGKSQYGVSVFDFVLPRAQFKSAADLKAEKNEQEKIQKLIDAGNLAPVELEKAKGLLNSPAPPVRESESRFIGYGPIPGL